MKKGYFKFLMSNYMRNGYSKHAAYREVSYTAARQKKYARRGYAMLSSKIGPLKTYR